MLLRVMLFALLLAMPLSATAEPLTPEKTAAIAELMELTGQSGTEVGMIMSQAMVGQVTSAWKSARPDLPAKAFDILEEEVNAVISENMDDLMVTLMPVYNRHYTLPEIRDLIAFYKTPLGKKVLAVTPQIQRESFAAGEAWGRTTLGPQIQQRLKARFEKEGLEL